MYCPVCQKEVEVVLINDYTEYKTDVCKECGCTLFEY